jgi:hypothetical protein
MLDQNFLATSALYELILLQTDVKWSSNNQKIEASTMCAEWHAK